MSIKIAVIGAGWYGCHIGSSFKALGFDVSIFEKEKKIFSKASTNNQYRLHQGFHYARSHRTRVQSRDGYLRFIERYKDLSSPVENNIYAVPTKDSLIDFATYKIIMTSSGVDFKEIDLNYNKIHNCSGGIKTYERVLNTKTAISFFENRLKDNLRLCQPVFQVDNRDNFCAINDERFDYVIDATWGNLSKVSKSTYFEATLLLYYTSKHESFALTLVDGDLCSIYPTDEKNIYTLSSVLHTPLAVFDSKSDATKFLNNIPSHVINDRKEKMEEQIMKYYPSFLEEFDYLSPQFSIKTKLVGSDDDRSCYVEREKRLFKVLSGKIDTVFFAAEKILNSIESEEEGVLHV